MPSIAVGPADLQPPVRGTHRLLMRLNLQNWSDRRAYFSGRYYQPDICRVLETLLQPAISMSTSAPTSA